MRDANDPLPYTSAGRMILIASILTPVAGTWWAIDVLSESLPVGRYPLILFCLPFILPAIVLFFGGCAICRRMGISVRKDDVFNDRGIPEPARDAPSKDAKPKRFGYCNDCEEEVELDGDHRCPRCGWPV